MSAPVKYPSGSIGSMFPELAALMEQLLAERNRLERQLAAALAEVARLRRRGDPCGQQGPHGPHYYGDPDPGLAQHCLGEAQ